MSEHEKYVHVQTVLPEHIVKKIKERTKETSIKDALLKTVYFYLDEVKA